MNNENEYTDANGVRYVAKDAPMGRCCGCAHAELFAACDAAAACTDSTRADERYIIWIKAV